ncbi:MAG: DUF4422 domain-containing protein [Bacteroidales bacterium]
MKKIILFSAFHKTYIAPKAKWVVPIHAGKALSSVDLKILGDNTGDNISQLNPIYCELTMAYWVWKNADRGTFDYWGLMHYRRYLLPQTLWTKLGKRKTFHFAPTQTKMDSVINSHLKKSISKDLKNYDIILPLPLRLNKKDAAYKSVEDHYCEKHLESHWRTLKEVIVEKYPDYQESMICFNKNTFYTFNMMIASCDVWDQYLSWLFDILNETSKRIEIPIDSYQKRYAGFLSERLLNLYVFHHKLTIKSYITAEFI